MATTPPKRTKTKAAPKAKAPAKRASKAKASASGAGAAKPKASSKGGRTTAKPKASPRRSKTTASARGAAGARSAARWTEAQVKVLRDAVQASPTAKAGFERAAAELGKSVGTVSQKYYALQRSAGKTGRRVTTRAASARTAGAARVSKVRTAVADATPADLARMTTDEVARLAEMVRGEIDRRQAELSRLSKLFSRK
jgi:hypothetical protein